MSAMILGTAHIRALTNWAIHYGLEAEVYAELDADRRAGECDRAAYGRRLLEANIASVSTLYADGTEAVFGVVPTFEPGPEKARLYGPLTILQACRCFDYQADQVEGYHTTWAARAIAEIRRGACAVLLRDVRLPDDLSGWTIKADEPPETPALAPRFVGRLL